MSDLDMPDDADLYAYADADVDYDLEAYEPTPSQFLERLKREWAALVEQGDDTDDGWPIRDEPLPTTSEAAPTKKETTHD